jgi:hypothetical protein
MVKHQIPSQLELTDTILADLARALIPTLTAIAGIDHQPQPRPRPPHTRPATQLPPAVPTAGSLDRLVELEAETVARLEADRARLALIRRRMTVSARNPRVV